MPYYRHVLNAYSLCTMRIYLIFGSSGTQFYDGEICRSTILVRISGEVDVVVKMNSDLRRAGK